MGFLSFVCLLIIAGVVSLLLAYLPKLKIKLPGGIVTTVVVGYIGARLGERIFGYWPFLILQDVSILPSILGALIGILLVRAWAEGAKK